MATKAAPPGVQSQAPQPGLAPAAPPAAQSQAGSLLRGFRPSFVLMARLDRLEVSGGLVLPDLSRIEAVAGRGGNTAADTVHPGGWVQNMVREGWQQVPDGLDFVVWGANRAGCASGCTYRDWRQTDRVAGMWSEAWSRPKIYGAVTRWQIDHDGKRAFQAAVLRWLLNGSELDDDLIDAACAPVIEIARAYLGSANPNTIERLKAAVAQLPPDRIPSDLAPYALKD